MYREICQRYLTSLRSPVYSVRVGQCVDTGVRAEGALTSPFPSDLVVGYESLKLSGLVRIQAREPEDRVAAIRQLIHCSECKRWFEMEIDSTFSIPIFKYPKHWFFFGKRLDSFTEEISLCSWLCTKNFVDRQYALHHPDDSRVGAVREKA